ncbi:PRK06761 family protein [Bacillus sp. Marseille-Q7846]
MNTKLIIVEGLPGFGKSTTAKLINEILSQNKIEVELFLEGNLNHPADYDGVSCFNKFEFNRLLSNSGDFKEVLPKRVLKKGSNYLLPYSKMKNEFGDQFSEELFNAIFENDIYELPFDKNVELIADKWNDFAEIALEDNKVYIFECCFIQNPLTIGMIKYGEQKEKIINYVMKVAKIIENLNPMLLYVEQDNLEFSFRKALKERTPEWSTGIVDYYTNQGYGKEHNHSGVEGAIKVLEARRNLELEIFDMLKMKKEKINNTKYEIDSYRSMLKDKLTIQMVK